MNNWLLENPNLKNTQMQKQCLKGFYIIADHTLFT